MRFEEFETYAASIRKGCINKLTETEHGPRTGEYNWYAATYNRTGQILLASQSEYYD